MTNLEKYFYVKGNIDFGDAEHEVSKSWESFDKLNDNNINLKEQHSIAVQDLLMAINALERELEHGFRRGRIRKAIELLRERLARITTRLGLRTAVQNDVFSEKLVFEIEKFI